MFGKWIIVVGAAVAVGSFSLATDASAGGRGGHGMRAGSGPKGGSTNLGGRNTNAQTGAKSGGTSFPYGAKTNNTGSYGANGPYIGMKWIGNVP